MQTKSLKTKLKKIPLLGDLLRWGNTLLHINQTKEELYLLKKELQSQKKELQNEAKLLKSHLIAHENIEHTITELVRKQLVTQSFYQNQKLQAFLNPHTKNTLYIDISLYHRKDLKTGIHRVLKSQLKYLQELSQTTHHITPIYQKEENGIIGHYTTSDHTPISITKGDILYTPDLSTQDIQKATTQKLYDAYKTLGVKIVFFIHDILPITHREFFVPNQYQIHKTYIENITKVAHTLITTTKVGATTLKEYLISQNLPLPTIEVLPLGADIEPLQEAPIPPTPKATKDLLIVGTIEPRKGHLQLLQAFDILLSQNLPFTLTIVGKEGWQVEETLNAIKSHPNLGKNLHYLSFVDDTTLAKEYQKADAIIVASYAEGFGLPLLEAAHFQKDIIARDIEVFREILGDYPLYFKDTKDPQAIADTLKEYLSTPHTPKTKPTFHTWQTHTEALFKILLGIKKGN